MVIQNGVLGPSVPQPVEMGIEVAAALAPIPLRALEGKTVRNGDLTMRQKNVVMAASQVYVFFNKDDYKTIDLKLKS